MKLITKYFSLIVRSSVNACSVIGTLTLYFLFAVALITLGKATASPKRIVSRANADRRGGEMLRTREVIERPNHVSSRSSPALPSLRSQFGTCNVNCVTPRDTPVRSPVYFHVSLFLFILLFFFFVFSSSLHLLLPLTRASAENMNRARATNPRFSETSDHGLLSSTSHTIYRNNFNSAPRPESQSAVDFYASPTVKYLLLGKRKKNYSLFKSPVR